MKKFVKTILSLAMALNLSLSSVVCTSFADFVKKDDGKTYYTDDNGKNVTGWQTIGDKKYYFDENGIMQIGLKKIDGTYYYFSKDGKMATGTVIVEKKFIYKFGNDGKFKSKVNGWVKFKSGTYYCIKGKIQKGIVTISDEYGNKGQYYFDNNGKLVIDKVVEYKLSTLYIGSDGEIYSIIDNTEDKIDELEELKETKELYQEHIKECEDAIKELKEGQKDVKEMIDYYKQKANSSGSRGRMVYGANGSVSYKSDSSTYSYYMSYANEYQELYDEYADAIKKLEDAIKKDKNEIKSIDEQISKLKSELKAAGINV